MRRRGLVVVARRTETIRGRLVEGEQDGFSVYKVEGIYVHTGGETRRRAIEDQGKVGPIINKDIFIRRLADRTDGLGRVISER